jgi:hypothetical protein
LPTPPRRRGEGGRATRFHSASGTIFLFVCIQLRFIISLQLLQRRAQVCLSAREEEEEEEEGGELFSRR